MPAMGRMCSTLLAVRHMRMSLCSRRFTALGKSANKAGRVLTLRALFGFHFCQPACSAGWLGHPSRSAERQPAQDQASRGVARRPHAGLRHRHPRPSPPRHSHSLSLTSEAGVLLLATQRAGRRPRRAEPLGEGEHGERGEHQHRGDEHQAWRQIRFIPIYSTSMSGLTSAPAERSLRASIAEASPGLPAISARGTVIGTGIAASPTSHHTAALTKPPGADPARVVRRDLRVDR